MAVNLVIRFILAMFSIGLGMMVFMPILYTLSYDQTLWAGKPPDVLTRRDNIYQTLFALPLITLGLVILWGFMKATTKDPYEQYT